MSGALHAPMTSLMSPDHAAKLLDQVVYEHVVSLVDLELLAVFEQELWSALHECGFDDIAVPQIAKDMIDRALHRIPDDPRRFADFPEWRPDAAFEPAGDVDCELCEQEARELEHARPTSGKPKKSAPT